MDELPPAWVVVCEGRADFQIATDLTEQARLDAVRKDLGFDPREKAAELNPGRVHTQEGKPVKRSTKRILEELTEGKWEREERCWCQTPLDVLRERGVASGLTDFLEEVDACLVPLVGS